VANQQDADQDISQFPPGSPESDAEMADDRIRNLLSEHGEIVRADLRAETRAVQDDLQRLSAVAHDTAMRLSDQGQIIARLAAIQEAQQKIIDGVLEDLRHQREQSNQLTLRMLEMDRQLSADLTSIDKTLTG
jgi:hypothetical protein